MVLRLLAQHSINYNMNLCTTRKNKFGLLTWKSLQLIVENQDLSRVKGSTDLNDLMIIDGRFSLAKNIAELLLV